ncbi:MAG: hypothetical protein AABY93_15965 [Bacteroidota bacterium]
MNRLLLLSVGFVLSLGSCTQRLICPAYQSAFIYDKEALRKKFTYLQEDSTPRIFTASSSKNRYLVAVPESYRKKLRALQTVEMKPIYPEIPDSLKIDEEGDLLLAERDVEDSVETKRSNGLDPADTAYAITKAKEKFNVDQDNYMWYFRDALVLPDVRAALLSKNKKEETSESSAKEKKGFLGFFKNLFNKKSNDSSAVLSSQIPLSSDSTAVTKQKKDSKKKTKKEKRVEVKTKDPVKKEEEDGF